MYRFGQKLFNMVMKDRLTQATMAEMGEAEREGPELCVVFQQQVFKQQDMHLADEQRFCLMFCSYPEQMFMALEMEKLLHEHYAALGGG